MPDNTANLVKEVLELTPLIQRHVLRPIERSTGSRLAPNQFSILTILSEVGAETMVGLSRQIAVCRQQMTQLIDELAKKNLVRRTMSETDRRSVVVTITDLGLDCVKCAHQDALDALYPIFDGYTDAQKADLIQTAQTMREIMHG
ncbi:MAG: MarR family transcriptional regulator [Clostridia bacterium]